MENATSQFDWISWLSSIPGIPAGWGDTLASFPPASVVAMQADACDAGTARDMDLPERKAA